MFAGNELRKEIANLARIHSHVDFSKKAIKERRMFLGRVQQQMQTARDRCASDLKTFMAKEAEAKSVLQWDTNLTNLRRQVKENKKILGKRRAEEDKAGKGFGKFGSEVEYNRNFPDSGADEDMSDEKSPPRKKGFGYFGSRAEYERRHPDTDGDEDMSEEEAPRKKKSKKSPKKKSPKKKSPKKSPKKTRKQARKNYRESSEDDSEASTEDSCLDD
jgi:hypothetical protein